MALNSKRMQTFFNEFLISTTTFLNHFMTDCETKFLDFERKLNRIESNLVIVEAKLASVPLESDNTTAQPSQPPQQPPTLPANLPEPAQLNQTLSKSDEIPIQADNQQQLDAQNITQQQKKSEPENNNMIKISESYLYKKYFKMVKFGVPEQGVRVKMMSEGLDGNLLADPNLLIEKCPEDDEVVEE